MGQVFNVYYWRHHYHIITFFSFVNIISSTADLSRVGNIEY